VTTTLQRVAAGDATAVQECIDRYGGLVYTLARRMCPQGAEIDDAVQEVFIELWRKAERYDPNIAEESVFIAMIARRRLIDLQRRLARHAGSVDLPESLEATEPEPQSGAELKDSAAVAERAFRELRPEQQKILRLAVWDGLSHQRISELTGLPLGTVKTHARRGLHRLRELLQPSSRTSSAGGGA
jgi:RNA polymerase sigma factor (sigma-70 family)